MSDGALQRLVALAGTDTDTLFADLMRHSAVPTGVSDPQTGRFLVVNDALCEYVGYSQEELQHLTWSQINHPDDVGPTREWIERVHSGEVAAYRIQKRYVRSDGGLVWGDLSITPMRRADGSVWAFVGQIMDITGRVEAQEALRASEEKFRLIAENSADVIWRITPERTVSYVSPSVTRLLGWTPEELIGAPALDVLDDATRAALPVDDALRRGTTQFRGRLLHKRGHRVPCDVTTAVLRDGDDVEGVVISMLDATAAVRSEQELAASEQRYRLLAENASDVVFECSPQAEIRWVSPSVLQELGHLPEEMVGWPLMEFLHPADVPRVQRANDTVNDGRPTSYRARVRAADEAWHWVEVTAKPVLDADGEVIASVGGFRNVDPQVHTEEALARAKDEALSASLAKTAFLSRMSHELRTPLNAVLGFAQLLDMDPLTEDQREAVYQIRNGGRHLLDLINEILDISRIEAGRLSLSLESVDLADAAAEALELVRATADEHGIALRCADVTGLHVFADRQRLIQILLNLLSNAVQYNRPDGSALLTAVTAGDDVVIRCTDTGPGVPDHLLERMFHPFDRLGAESSGIEGTGIGLALSRGLAEVMGGSLQAESTVGQGSTFTVRLPGAPVPERVAVPPVGFAPSGAQPRRVLYIEDNPANVLLMERICDLRENTLLAVATTALDGVDQATRNPPDLVLLDLHLPDMTGGEVLTTLRRDPRTARVPIVVVSADVSRAAQEISQELGADGYLPKPIDVNGVLQWIEHPDHHGGHA